MEKEKTVTKSSSHQLLQPNFIPFNVFGFYTDARRRLKET